jgi:hypothetical protein
MTEVLASKASKQTKQQTKKSASKQAVPERMVNDAPRTFTDADFEIGTVSHQGDVILVRIRELPAGAKPRLNRQMAIGSTQGARHILERGDAFDCDAEKVVAAIRAVCPGTEDIPAQYVGPVFKTRDGVASLPHPEHGDQHFEGDMTIACVYQRNLDAEEREQRVRD